jgi:hypothetical protein
MLKILRRLALCLAPLTFLAPLAAQTLPQGITKVRSVEGIDEYRLANGLQILLVPDDSKPSTTVNLTYRVGSKHENVGETGMAHLLEHMLFKGSPKHPQVWAEFTKRRQRQHQLRPHQLHRQLLGQRRQPAVVPGLAGRFDGQQPHRARRPRQRDDGGAQRDGKRRKPA